VDNEKVLQFKLNDLKYWESRLDNLKNIEMPFIANEELCNYYRQNISQCHNKINQLRQRIKSGCN